VKKRDRPIPKNRALRSNLPPKVLTAIHRGVYRQPFFRAGDRVGVAISGGADSVALLLLLVQLQSKLGVVLSVVHINHQLRGRASDGDERFVAKLAKRHGFEFLLKRVDVAAKAKRDKLNLEDAARRARYEFFAALVKQSKLHCVATAHTADDQAETVLAHMLRGAGLAGIGGIHSASGGVVRPLLGIRRAALRVYLREVRQAWREDATNRDTTKLRARIRKKLLPLLETQFQPATVEHLCQLAEFAREDNAKLEFTAEWRVRALATPRPDGIRMNALEILGQARNSTAKPGEIDPLLKTRTLSVSRRMVRYIVKEVKPQAGELGARHVEATLALAEYGENGKSLQLPGGVEVRRERDQLVFCATRTASAKARSRSKNAPRTQHREFEHAIDFAKEKLIVSVPCLERDFCFTKIDWPRESEETNSQGSVLNHDALCNPLVLRNWRPGDTFQPLGHRKSHKLKRLLNEARVSRWERDGWPVLTSGGVIAWARGFPVGAAFAATAETQSAVRIEECATSSH
jgi:tRNA(Ile)-lysidine synthase